MEHGITWLGASESYDIMQNKINHNATLLGMWEKN